MKRFSTVSSVGIVLSVLPFVLLLALLMALVSGLSGWWLAGIVGVGYLHAVTSGTIVRWMHRIYLGAPTLEPGERASCGDSRLTPSQRAFIASADPCAVPHSPGLQLVFPTVLLALAASGTWLSLRAVAIGTLAILALLVAWLIASLMLMWPLHRRIYVERGMRSNQLVLVSVAMWMMYGLVWLTALGVIFVCLRSSLTLALAWSTGLALGVALALWKPPLVWQTSAVEPSDAHVE